MAHIILTRQINAPISKVWEAWNDYANIDRFNPNLSGSFLIDKTQATGLGATRQCDMKDGKNYIQERIVEYVPMQKIKVDIYNGTLPLNENWALIEMQEDGPNQTTLTFTMHFVPKYGLFGRMMIPLIKAQSRRLLGKLVDANKAYVEDGVEIMRAA